MTEQHYRVVADRDRGDEPTARDVREDDRVTVGVNYSDSAGVWGTDSVLVRIERPMPTTDKPDWRAIARDQALTEAAAIARDVRRRELDMHQCSFDEMPESNRTFVYGADRAAEHIEAARHRSPHPPTREQIAEALYRQQQRPVERIAWADLPGWVQSVYLDMADAVLALIQNGADR